MTLQISQTLLKQIHLNGQAAYPEEGAGLMLGKAENQLRLVQAILPIVNSREQSARHNRYLITAQDMLYGEQEAMRQGMDVIGVFHSHPDHPNQPSEFDLEWALPWYSYLITRVNSGEAIASRSWQLAEDRTSFFEEQIQIIGE